MSTSHYTQYEQTDPWRDEGQIFRAVAIFVLLFFAGFVFYDGRQFYQRYVKRCHEAPDRPECSFLSAAKPTPIPELGIVLDQGSGKWAIQLEAMDQKTANENSTRLIAAGANPRLIKTTGRKKVVFYYVQLGRFKTQKAAVEAGGQLKARGLLTSFTVSTYRSVSN